MLNSQPAPSKTYFLDMPLARLHVLETGEGEPLIMVPATISELENWRTLAQFMAQWFRVYFFELPGHGGSEPFRDGFSSRKVAELVGQLADHLGCQRFNLMGFSFGGILALRTFQLLSHRIDRMILIAPLPGTSRASLLKPEVVPPSKSESTPQPPRCSTEIRGPDPRPAHGHKNRQGPAKVRKAGGHHPAAGKTPAHTGLYHCGFECPTQRDPDHRFRHGIEKAQHPLLLRHVGVRPAPGLRDHPWHPAKPFHQPEHRPAGLSLPPAARPLHLRGVKP